MASKGTRVAGALLRRVAKPIPIVGAVVVLATAASVLRRKGALRGTVDIALDAIPFLGTAKGLLELVTGDLIPEKPSVEAGKSDELGAKAA